MVTWAEKIIEENKKYAFTQGSAARILGKSLMNNPYKTDTKEYNEWNDGFKDSLFLYNLTKNVS